MKLNQRMKMTESYEEEMESIKVSAAQQQQTILDKMEMEHNVKMGRLNKKVWSKICNYFMLKFAVSTYSEIFRVRVGHLFSRQFRSSQINWMNLFTNNSIFGIVRLVPIGIRS